MRGILIATPFSLRPAKPSLIFKPHGNGSSIFITHQHVSLGKSCLNNVIQIFGTFSRRVTSIFFITFIECRWLALTHFKLLLCLDIDYKYTWVTGLCSVTILHEKRICVSYYQRRLKKFEPKVDYLINCTFITIPICTMYILMWCLIYLNYVLMNDIFYIHYF